MANFTLTPRAITASTELTSPTIAQVNTLNGTGTVPTLSRNNPNDLVVNFGRIDTTDNSTGTILESGILDTTVNFTLRIYVATVNRQGNLQAGGNNCDAIVNQIPAGTRLATPGNQGSANSASYILKTVNYPVPTGTNNNLLDYQIAITHNASSYAGGSNNRRWLTIDLIELDVEVIELVPPGKSQAIWV